MASHTSGEDYDTNVQVGTVLMKDCLVMVKAPGLQSVPYFANWGVLTALDGLGINRHIQAAGWNFFFMAAEVKVMFFGALGARRMQNALRRMLVKVKPLNFNCLEVTGIAAKQFLGVPYTVVSAHSRHIQESCYLDGAGGRRSSQREASHDGV